MAVVTGHVQALPEIAISINHQPHSTTGESPYRVVFKQQMLMQRLSFADRVIAISEDENLDGSESDASDRECENDSESLADDNVFDTIVQATNISDLEHTGNAQATAPSSPAPINRPLPSPSLSPIYIDSGAPDESDRSQDASDS